MRGLLAALLFLAGACGWRAGWALDEAERAELIAAGKASPVRKLETWSSWLARPTQARIGPAPKALLEYLAIDNRLLGYPGIPKASTDPGPQRLLRTALAQLPPAVLQLVEDRLVAIVIVRDLGSSGFADIVRDAAGSPVGAFVVLDESLFTRRANAWASWRNSTVFRSHPGYRIRTRIARDGEDTRLAAVQFLLVHELAHVYTVGRDIHPPWGDDLARYDLDDFPFARLSWEIDPRQGRYRAREGSDFPQREQIRFYREPALPATDIPAILSRLQQTAFVSLYAATSPEEDFAEAFAMYVHHEMLGRPYVSEALVDGRVEVRFTPCFPDRCRQKYELLKSLIQP